jgi:hypothetical protein
MTGIGGIFGGDTAKKLAIETEFLPGLVFTY